MDQQTSADLQVSPRPRLPIPLSPRSRFSEFLIRWTTGLSGPSFERVHRVTRYIAGCVVVGLVASVPLALRDRQLRVVATGAVIAVSYLVLRVLLINAVQRRQLVFEETWRSESTDRLRSYAFELVRCRLVTSDEGGGTPNLGYRNVDPQMLPDLAALASEPVAGATKIGTLQRVVLEFAFPADGSSTGLESIHRQLDEIRVVPMPVYYGAPRVSFPQAYYVLRPLASRNPRLPREFIEWSLVGEAELQISAPSRS